MLRLALAIAACALLVPAQALASAGHVVVSQVYGGGGNSGATLTNDFVELYNDAAAPVSLEGWSVQYASSTGTSWQATPLAGSIPAHGYYLVQESQGSGGTTPLPAPDATGSIPMSGSKGKIALSSGSAVLSGSCPTASIVDFVGYGSANCFEGSGPAGGLENDTAAIRADGGCTDTDDNATDFAIDAPTPRSSSSPAHTCGGPPANQPVKVDCGSGISTAAGTAASTDVTATDADGVVDALDVVSVTPEPSAGSIARTAFSAATAAGGTATATITATDDVPAGNYDVVLRATNADATPQTAQCTLSVAVTGVIAIGTVQGSGTASPYEGQTVTVRGVVTEKTLDQVGGRYDSNGFYLQNTAATADGDASTSDGVWVYLGRYTDLIGGYRPVVGDEIVMSGKVSEYFDLTELGSATIVKVVASGVSIDPFVADPPADAGAAAAYWEAHEGMQALIPQGSVVDSPRHTYASSADSEFYAIAPSASVAQRSDPFARRAFRDAHPLDDLPGLFDNGNGYRILVTDSGVKAVAGDNAAFLEPVHTFQTFAAASVGGVDYAFGKYSVDVSAQPQLAAGVDPSTNAPPTAFDRGTAYSLANFNVENLYDYRDDPNDGCDFLGNSGCPGVSPPFDYTPASNAEYQSRLTEIAHQVIDALHAPDAVAIAEAEDQDICTVESWTLTCGTADNADGKPDTIQELAVRIHELGGPAYDAAFDRDGADDRGIVSAILYRTDRVELLPASADDAVLGSDPQVEYRSEPLPYDTDVSNPKSLNAVLPADVDRSTGTDGSNVFTRAPQVAHLRIWRTAIGLSTFQDVWLIANHFSSGPDSRVGQRREQAAYNAAIVKAIEAEDPDAKVMVAGDLNDYPRPDDPFPPPATSDQLAPLYDVAGMHDLYDTLLSRHPSSAYSYVYEGQAQDLDHQFTSDALFSGLEQVRVAHVNSDWSADVADDGNRGTSDHDPMLSRYGFGLSVDSLRELVLYYRSTGAVSPAAADGLLKRLDNAQKHLDAGLQNPYANDLHAFAQDATHGTPGTIEASAGRALAAEAAALAG
ncbi:MAG TPA: lamin tail domain-containing protein [Gaiellaceae bacterium]|nr:lamin tail domain-containing protein [Gaiellaceae bacterium]